MKVWLTSALGWPVFWLVFMYNSPGPLTPPPAPQVQRQVSQRKGPPVDQTGSVDATDNQGLTSTSAGIRIFWDIPEPGRIKLTLELDGSGDADNPLILSPE